MPTGDDVTDLAPRRRQGLLLRTPTARTPTWWSRGRRMRQA